MSQPSISNQIRARELANLALKSNGSSHKSSKKISKSESDPREMFVKIKNSLLEIQDNFIIHTFV